MLTCYPVHGNFFLFFFLGGGVELREKKCVRFSMVACATQARMQVVLGGFNAHSQCVVSLPYLSVEKTAHIYKKIHKMS